MIAKSLALAGAALTVLASPALAQDTAPKQQPVPVATLVKAVDIPWQRFTLKNGLRVIVHTDRKAPVVAVSVWYNVGAKMEPAGETGFAHLYEHLMFNGSEHLPGDYFTYLKKVGATDYNGTTNSDRTNYFETVPTPALPSALFMEADRMGHLLPALTQGVLDEQRGVVQNEKRQGDNQPYGMLRYKQVEGLYPATHPYGHTTIGSMADLDAASLANVKTWFSDHYGPNNAVLVLAGDIDLATAKAMVEKAFGAIPRGPQVTMPAAPVPTLPASKAETITDRIPNPRLYRMWAVPGLNSPDKPALDIAASALGGLETARLYQILVKNEKIATSARAGMQSFAQAGIFQITVDVKPGVDPALVNRRIDAILADFLKTGPTADEVQRIATWYAVNRIQGLEQVGGFGGQAVALAQGELFSGDPDHYKKELAALAGETPAHVLTVAQKWLSRPVYALTIAPGARAAYAEAQAPKPVVKAAAAAPEKSAAIDPGAVEPLRFPTIEHTTLSNGIPLMYAQRTTVPITRAMLSFDAGDAADVPGKIGTEGFTLAMLYEGVPGLDSTAIGVQSERLGAAISTGASDDETHLGLTVPSANLTPALDLFAAMARTPTFPQAELERVRGQRLVRVADEKANPSFLADIVLTPLLYGAGHPYSKGIGTGDPAAIRAMTRDDLIAFQQAWLRPDKARLYVVSDRPLAEVKAALEAHFGDWKPAPVAAGIKDFTKPPVATSPRIVLVDRPDSPQSVIMGAAQNSLKGTDDTIPYSTANTVLGGDFLSRINMDLREDKHWSYGVSGSFVTRLHAMPYLVSAPVQGDKTGAALAELRTDIAAFVTDKPIDQAEFDRTIEGTVREGAGSFETGGQVLNALASIDRYHRPDDYYQTMQARLRALTLPQLNAAARAAILPDRFFWVVVGDAAKVKPQLDAIGLPVEVVPATPPAPAK